MIERECKACKGKFYARQADVNRGWGLFCSKSCKAIKQAQSGGGKKKRYPRHDGLSKMKHRFCNTCGDNAVNGVHTSTGIEWFCERHRYEATLHPFDSEALGQW